LLSKNGGVDKSGQTKVFVEKKLVTCTSNGVEEKKMERFQDIKRLKDYM